MGNVRVLSVSHGVMLASNDLQLTPIRHGI
jgi:hypothetical protein